MKRAYGIASVALILAAAASYLFVGREQPDTAIKHEARDKVAKTIAPDPSMERSVSVIGPAAPAPTIVSRAAPVSEKLRADFATASNWRAFVLAALARPKEGGYFYAIYAAELCSRDVQALSKEGEKSISSTVSATGTVSNALQDTVKKLSIRCADFSRGEAAELSRAARKRAEDGMDPLMAAADHLSASLQAKDRAKLEASLSELLATQDPLVLEDSENLRRAMSAGFNSEKNDAGFYFDGVNYLAKRDEELGAVVFALQLATCVDNLPCALSNSMELNCITGGDCSKDRVTYVKKELAAAGAAQVSYEHVDDLRRKISTAIANNEVKAFLAPR